MGNTRLAVGRIGQPVNLVEDHHCDGGVPSERSEVALVQCSVGILLGINHPAECVDDLDQPVDLGHMRGRS